MSAHLDRTPLTWRSRWAALGAAVAVTLGAGGLISVSAAGTPSSFVPITPVRVLDTRINAGLTGALVSDTPRLLDVTGTIPVVKPGNQIGVGSPVPDGATSIVANVTGVNPSTIGFVAIRPGTATGDPTTSSLNFASAGQVVPNSVTVELPITGGNAGKIQLWFHGTAATATTHLLIDIVGYYVPGAAGPKGDKGDQGDRGLSSWDVIPSGQTVIGEFMWDVHQSNLNTSSNYQYVSFGAIAPMPLTSDKVNFAETTTPTAVDADPSCTGTADVPTAPAGKVCIYAYDQGGIDLSQLSGGVARLADRGFFAAWAPSGSTGADEWLWATWAYTAP